MYTYTFSSNILAESFDIFSCYHLPVDLALYSDGKLLAGQVFLQFHTHLASNVPRSRRVANHGQLVNLQSIQCEGQLKYKVKVC